jgi:hypothetical protein
MQYTNLHFTVLSTEGSQVHGQWFSAFADRQGLMQPVHENPQQHSAVEAVPTARPTVVMFKSQSSKHTTAKLKLVKSISLTCIIDNTGELIGWHVVLGPQNKVHEVGASCEGLQEHRKQRPSVLSSCGADMAMAVYAAHRGGS